MFSALATATLAFSGAARAPVRSGVTMSLSNMPGASIEIPFNDGTALWRREAGTGGAGLDARSRVARWTFARYSIRLARVLGTAGQDARPCVARWLHVHGRILPTVSRTSRADRRCRRAALLPPAGKPWDPLGLAKLNALPTQESRPSSNPNVKWLREAELKHGRICMLVRRPPAERALAGCDMCLAPAPRSRTSPAGRTQRACLAPARRSRAVFAHAAGRTLCACRAPAPRLRPPPAR
jgi:hypothetical protein